MKTKGSDAAFGGDTLEAPTGQFIEYKYGLTKREYFAAMAMQALVSKMEYDLYNAVPEALPICAVELADALIGALNK